MEATETISIRSGRRRRLLSDSQRLLVLLFVLGLMLIACKGTLLPLPRLDPGRIARWTVRLGVVGAADAAYVSILGLVLWPLMRLCRWVAPHRGGWSWALVWTVAAISALYGAASVAIFERLTMQLTYPMLQFFGEFRDMASSVRAVVSWQTWLALSSVLAVLVAGYRIGIWLMSRWPVRLSRPRALSLAVLALVYFGFSYWWSQTQWQDRSLWQARLARSPHLRLIESLVVMRPMAQAVDYSPEAVEFEDFRPAQRPDERVDAAGSGRQPKKPKNIVVVVLESVAAEYMGVYGAPYDNTPHLERLSEHALVFENIYVQCPSSAKAMVAMLCGVYPRMDWREQTRAGQLPVDSLADVLGRRGFRTGFFHSGDWTWRGGEEFLEDHGFQYIRDARHLPKEELSWGQYDSWLYDEAFRWIDRSQDPFLAVAWTIQTHHPYVVEGPVRDYGADDEELNRYLNGIRESDELIGRIWKGLEQRGLAESTLLLVIGDHGEAFGQHDQRLHIFGLYEENVHVPLVIVHRDEDLPVGRRETIGQQIDLPATLAECAAVPGSPHWQGRSLLSPGRPPRAYFYTVWDPVILGVRQGRFKYTMEIGRRDALFDVAGDPRELRNVVKEHPELREALRRRLHALVAYEHHWRQDLLRAAPRLATADESRDGQANVAELARIRDAPVP